jgi:hypothetical protein
LSIARKLEKYEANDYANVKVKEKFVFAVMIKLGIYMQKNVFDLLIFMPQKMFITSFSLL